MFVIQHRLCAALLWLALALFPASAFANLNATLRSQLNPFPVDNRYGDVWGEGRYAYLASYNGNGVMIIDIADPRAPRLVSHFDPPPGAQTKDVFVLNGILYCSSDDGHGVFIADVTDAANPRLLGRITAAENGFASVHELFVADGYLYEADSRTPRVKVFDLKNPSAPVFVRDIQTTDTLFIHNMTALNGRLYTSGWSGKTDIYDVRNIGAQAPPLLGVVDSGRASHSSWVSNDGKLLASCRETFDGDVRLFDISNPANPQMLAALNAQALGIEGFSAHNAMIMGNLLFVSWYQAGTVVLDITNPAQPVLIGHYDSFSGTINGYDGNWGVYPFLGLDRVLLSDLDGGLLVVDFSTAAAGPRTVSAASYGVAAFAPKAIVTAFGANLATGILGATALPLPTTLAGATVRVTDVKGVERAAPLFFASPTQINYQMPADTAPGPVSLKFESGGRSVSGNAVLAAAAPTIFTLNQSGSGPAVAVDAFNFTAAPFAARQANGQPNIIAVFGTGLGADATDVNGNVAASVLATINGNPVTVQYAGRVPGLVGLNQFNLVLPAGLSAGTHTLIIARQNSALSNAVTLAIR